MKLLILGGTQFVGRHVVETALAAGHDLTLFNRGRTGPALFPGVTTVIGDRRADLSALAGGAGWDAVIDCCGYLPSEVARSADFLSDRAERYVFVSSVSAYAGFATPNEEGSPLGVLADPSTEVIDGASYGPLKAACERALRERYLQERVTVVRPGLVVGPHDPTQRFTWWPARLAAPGPVLAPGRPDDAVQFIDARDLAAFILGLVERASSGTFNAVTGPAQHTRGALLAACAAAAGARPEFVWADDARLVALGVKPWNDLPLWLPPEGDYAAFMETRNAAALAAGLRLRPLAETVADTLAWWRSLPADQQAFTKAGLAPEREAELITACRAAPAAAPTPATAPRPPAAG